MYPDDRYYSQEHEWVEPVEDGEYVLGITQFAQEELGDVVFVELPEVGSRHAAESEIGTIESVKAVAELFAPVSGEVTAVNEEVLDRPELLNEDPHGQGWLLRLKPEKADAHEDMMTADQYREFIGEADESEDDLPPAADFDDEEEEEEPEEDEVD